MALAVLLSRDRSHAMVSHTIIVATLSELWRITSEKGNSTPLLQHTKFPATRKYSAVAKADASQQN